MFSTHSSSRGHGDYHPSYHHQHQQHHQKTEQQQQPHQQRSPYSSNSHQVEYFHSRSPTTKTSSSFNSAFAYHSAYPMMTPKEEERESSYTRAMTPHQHHQTRAASSPLLKEEEDDEEEDDDRSEYAPSMSHSPSMSHAGSSFSRESSPLMTSDRLGSMSEASDSMTSLVSSSSSTGSMTPVPTTTQLLLCPVCSRAFKPSKNQNCNLRRHLKNVHNMSPTMHPRKCKWDSLPDGRVKDDKDRKERTRKSKRLWARKFRLRRKVEEAAVVLSMLSQAV
ncbi:hypothetical protein BGZ58_003830 [Dissophora ornata]|nr:hypothetical protein BGZ58_003830 [Dissophora ornata]